MQLYYLLQTKDGDYHWLAVSRDKPSPPIVPFESPTPWSSNSAMIWLFHMGRVFATKEAAEAWIAEFGDVWTSRVEGEGE